ncbi:hypothetical protein QBC46DRAFT_5157 [Diplogelasinospora grovesii]|uniref:Uncharacterized protein n=1 Tax=Diplogelasinospora grovesii TaxID=303347 RepID=A0AAN6NJS0_9PEZI|nr:hypothetical protein QBC46DRAFT_5157 [Diplogelasinospora grovesii]
MTSEKQMNVHATPLDRREMIKMEASSITIWRNRVDECGGVNLEAGPLMPTCSFFSFPALALSPPILPDLVPPVARRPTEKADCSLPHNLTLLHACEVQGFEQISAEVRGTALSYQKPSFAWRGICVCNVYIPPYAGPFHHVPYSSLVVPCAASRILPSRITELDRFRPCGSIVTYLVRMPWPCMARDHRQALSVSGKEQTPDRSVWSLHLVPSSSPSLPPPVIGRILHASSPRYRC